MSWNKYPYWGPARRFGDFEYFSAGYILLKIKDNTNNFCFFLGFAWAGFSVNHLDVAPQYAAILMGISNTIGTIPGIISPAITGYLVEDKSVASWQHVFVITAFVYALGMKYAFKKDEHFVPNILAFLGGNY